MPQLVKGGKYVFGWSKVKKNGELKIPDEAYLEYRFSNDHKGILISGSKTSGGFGLSSIRILKNSRIWEDLKIFPELINFELLEGETINIKNRKLCWIKINENGSIKPPNTLLKNYALEKNTNFLVVRGSGIALGFITQGLIYDEAKKHSTLISF